MKTIVTIEDGRITIQVDDGLDPKQPAIELPGSTVMIQTAPKDLIKSDGVEHITPRPPAVTPDVSKVTETVERKCLICEADISNTHRLRKLCGKTECMLEQQRRSGRKSYHAVLGHTPPEKRSCVVCGDDITNLDKRRKVCMKPACKQEIKRRSGYAWFERNKENKPDKPEPAKEPRLCNLDGCDLPTMSSRAHYCSEEHRDQFQKEYQKKYRQNGMKPLAFGKRVKPTFLPGHEKTPEEVEAWRPKVTGVTETIKHANHQAERPASSFTDPWDCDGCRQRGQLCPMHKSMTDAGKKPLMYRQ